MLDAKVCQPDLSQLRLTDLSVEHVLAFHHTMLTRFNYRPSVARHRLFTFREVEKFAIRRKWMRMTPVSDAISDIDPAPQERITTFQASEISKLLATAAAPRRNVPRHAHAVMDLAVHVAAYCGLRYGEIMALTKDAIDFEAGMISVRHNLTQWDDLKTPKTAAGVRCVPMPDVVANKLRA